MRAARRCCSTCVRGSAAPATRRDCSASPLDPQFAANGWLWLYYSVDRSAEPGPRRTRLSRFSVDAERGPLAADAGSELVILEVEQPYSNHNGGAIRFGPDGMLYLGLGDGGSAGDPRGNGQNLGTLLGSIIRINVRDASTAAPYGIPPDNPFADTPGARGEIWAYGLRNPWRMAFDSAGRLWVGDVGQQALEEVDVAERGRNYGWNRLEGTRCFRPSSGCDREGTTPPVAEYGRSLGCSVTGGVVYEGPGAPSLAGSYLFADYCSGRVWALEPGGGSRHRGRTQPSAGGLLRDGRARRGLPADVRRGDPADRGHGRPIAGHAATLAPCWFRSSRRCSRSTCWPRSGSCGARWPPPSRRRACASRDAR